MRICDPKMENGQTRLGHNKELYQKQNGEKYSSIDIYWE